MERENLERLKMSFSRATCPEDVFGSLAGNAAERRLGLRTVYAKLSRSCHPDLADSRDKALAETVFGQLAQWKQQAEQKLAAGTYGDRQPLAPPAPAFAPIELCLRGRRLLLNRVVGEGTFATVYEAEYEGYTDGAAFAKIARDTADNDLLMREQSTLRLLHEAHPDASVEAFLLRQRTYIPQTLTAFSVAEADGGKRRGTVLSVPTGRCFTIETLRKSKFPNGVEPRHAHWIFRRLLLTLWMAHLQGHIHGAVTPDHVLVYPEEHGIVLLDWTCAAKIGEEYVPAINPAFAAYCPPEMAKKAMAKPASDLYQAAATMIYLLGGDPAKSLTVPNVVSAPIARALEGCLAANPRRRPQDAERFHNEYGEILLSVYGKRTYAHFQVP